MSSSGIFRTVVVWLLLNCSSMAWARSTAADEPIRSDQKLTTSVTTNKARYSPGDPVLLAIDIDNEHRMNFAGARLLIRVQELGKTVTEVARPLPVRAQRHQHLNITVIPPKADYRGYRVEIRILDSKHRTVSLASTAIDVSSNWRRFPRYGYLAHFDPEVPAEQWIANLNRFHIDGLQFYDFQYKHHLPAPPPEAASTGWRDIANRPISSRTLASFLSAARRRNMMTMAYNASYAAYDDAFSDGSGVKLEWAAWPDEKSPRTAATAKSLSLPPGWATPRIVYMNQDDLGWQNYIFSRMRQLFVMFPFDGWHIDTYGDAGAFAWDGTSIDYFSGFPKFADAAHVALNKPVLLNTVGAHGQEAMARSSVDFVYSELWPEDHATYASIVQAADQIHASEPQKGLVFAAYLHRERSDRLRQTRGHAHFDTPAVLLADAVMFSAGASHIELGDGDRMLSNPYFPANTEITPTNELREKLRFYYDFLVAYENYLGDGITPGSFSAFLSGAPHSTTGQPGAVWTIARQRENDSILHLINLTALKRSEWRDDALDCQPAPLLHNLKVAIDVPSGVESAGWASPDVDQGAWHTLAIEKNEAGMPQVTLPELQYWSVVIFHRLPAGH